MPPLVSIVIETVTARVEGDCGPLAEGLRPTLDAVERQTWPAEAREVVIVVDPDAPREEVEALRRDKPALRVIVSSQRSYFAAKNEGAEAARGEYVALLDSDCVPATDWLARSMARFEPGVDVVAGRTRYQGTGWIARLLSIPDFAYVVAAPDGHASGFNINNIVFRRATLLAHPFEARIRRNGACYLLFQQLRRNGIGIAYEPAARTAHALDPSGAVFIRKHFDRGYDSIAAYRADDGGDLKGTPYFRRYGAFALPPIFLRRTMLDWVNLIRHRRQIGFPLAWLPLVLLLAPTLRAIEFAGALWAAVRGERLDLAQGARLPGF